MGRALGYRKRHLASLPTASPELVPAEVPGDRIHPVQRLKQVPRQDDRFDQLGQLAVPDHVAVARSEGKVFEVAPAAQRVAAVDPEPDALEQVIQASPAVRDVRVGEPDDRCMAEGNRAGISGGHVRSSVRRSPGSGAGLPARRFG
mgnify:CR=1 FL=1